MNDTLDRTLADTATANAIRTTLHDAANLTGRPFPPFDVDTFRGESNAWIVMADGTEITLAADMSTGATLVSFTLVGPDGRIVRSTPPQGTVTTARALAATLTGWTR